MEDLNQSNNEILEKIQAGDRETWTRFVHTYYEPLKGFINRMLQQSALAEELAQDVFANFWNKRNEINIQTSLKAYLYRTARNLTLNHIKRSKLEAEYTKNLGKTATFKHNDTEEIVDYTELQLILDKEIADLPDECQEIFKLSRYEELSYKEIADALEIPVRRVHYQIGLALKTLRDRLKKRYGANYLSALNIILFILLYFF
jgi:RNA polymerase sigma-70 factor (ECF subfamily)